MSQLAVQSRIEKHSCAGDGGQYRDYSGRENKSAVHIEDRAGHVGRGVVGEKHDDSGNLAFAAKPSHRVLRT